MADLSDFVVTYYSATDGWRWRAVAGNNRIIGASSEAYVNLTDAVSNFEQLRHADLVVEYEAAPDGGDG